jgi:hypothetical protein
VINKDEDGSIPSQLLADVSALSLSELFACDDVLVTQATSTATNQVARPRLNLGASGPPGRAD